MASDLNGTKGLREKINKFRKINKDKKEFYDASEISLDALEILGARYKKLAEDMLDSCDEKDVEILNRIIKTFDNIPVNPPRDFFEACQFFWLEFSFDGIDSPGRFDQYMIDFYLKSDEDDRKICLEKLWELFKKFRVWNLCLSGSDENLCDKSNQLTFDILETARKYKYNTPNLTVRVHRNTPDNLWQSIAETIATGIGMPAIYSDEVVCPALEQLGINNTDSHNYCMNGCNQIDIFGKSHMGLEDGELNLAKCLRFALYNGICEKSGQKIGCEVGDASAFDTFDKLMDAYDCQVRHFTDVITSMANRSQQLYSVYAPNPYRSNMIEGCIERGKDHKAGGALYNNGQILMEGAADTADSLAAIKHYVYDTGKYSISQLKEALDKDFEGYEELLRDFSSYHKFGNGYDDVDSIYKYIAESFARYLLTINTWRGGVYGLGCSTFQRAAAYGENTGSMPNGKKSTSDLFSESIGAVPGCDVKGPTALMNSVLSFDHKLAKSGLVLQMKFNKEIFNSQDGMSKFISLAKIYLMNGGQQLSVNVVSSEELKEAKKHPERYKNLIVRVGGYSEHFVNISPGLQDNIIKRTELMR